MKAITFIGTGNYQPCRYQFNGDECETHLFPVAVSKFFKPSEMLVFLTEEARAAKAVFLDGKTKTARELEIEYYQNLENLNGGLRLEGKTYFEQLGDISNACGFTAPRRIPIKSGKSESELWEIFDSITSNLDENDEVVFDITHAFRSIPVLSFLIIAFLRETKNIRLKAIVYGAFEARDKTTKEAPVFDLTPFVELLDWMSATKQFKKTGNADFLVELLQNKGFKTLANKIDSISDGLKLLRPSQVMESSSKLSTEIENTKKNISNSSKPFVELIEEVQSRYKIFALTNKDERLKKELALAKWYFDNDMLIQSLILLREWLVSFVCKHLNQSIFNRYSRINYAEMLLNGETITLDGRVWSLDSIEGGELLRNSWKEIIKLRNDLSHAGYVKDPKSYRQIKKGIRGIFETYVKI